MKSVYTLIALLFTFQIHAQNIDEIDLNNEEMKPLLEKLSETSFIIFKGHQIIYTKSSSFGLKQITIDIETGHIQYLKVSGDSVNEYESWLDMSALSQNYSDLFSDPRAISGQRDTLNKADHCRGQYAQLEAAYGAVAWAYEYGTAEDINNAEMFLAVATAQLASCLQQVQTHPK